MYIFFIYLDLFIIKYFFVIFINIGKKYVILCFFNILKDMVVVYVGIVYGEVICCKEDEGDMEGG